MDASRKVENALDAIGATAEILWVFYRNLIKQGFSGEDAIFLCSTYLETLANAGGK